MEKKPNKKEQLTLVNNVLKLSTKLLKVSTVSCTFSTFTFNQLSLRKPIMVDDAPGVGSGGGQGAMARLWCPGWPGGLWHWSGVEVMEPPRQVEAEKWAGCLVQAPEERKSGCPVQALEERESAVWVSTGGVGVWPSGPGPIGEGVGCLGQPWRRGSLAIWCRLGSRGTCLFCLSAQLVPGDGPQGPKTTWAEADLCL